MPMVRLSKAAHQMLSALAREEEVTMAMALERAIRLYREDRMWNHVDLMFSDPEFAQRFRAEMSELEGTGVDGLEPAALKSPKGAVSRASGPTVRRRLARNLGGK